LKPPILGSEVFFVLSLRGSLSPKEPRQAAPITLPPPETPPLRGGTYAVTTTIPIIPCLQALSLRSILLVTARESLRKA
jgi:hypothetical protein